MAAHRHLRGPRRDDDEGRPRPGGRRSRSWKTELTSLPHKADTLSARALDGDREAFAELIAEPTLLEPPRFRTVIPALALTARQLGLQAPAPWHRQLLRTAAGFLRLETDLAAVGKALDTAGIAWMPIKGMDLASRLWPGPEARPTSDLDVLVPHAQLAEARATLVGAGWKGLAQRPVDEQYLQAEGYNWQARSVSGTLLELHFRLWSSTPVAWAEAVWAGSLEAPELGSHARRPSWADAFVLCAVHLWQDPPPHSLLYYRELELIARRCGEAGLAQVDESARRRGLSLQVSLAAHYVDRLWQNRDVRRLAESLQADLRPPERLLLRVAVARGTDAASLGQLYVARLLSGRETRRGWTAVFRRLIPHRALRARRVADDPVCVRSTREP